MTKNKKKYLLYVLIPALIAGGGSIYKNIHDTLNSKHPDTNKTKYNKNIDFSNSELNNNTINIISQKSTKKNDTAKLTLYDHTTKAENRVNKKTASASTSNVYSDSSNNKFNIKSMFRNVYNHIIQFHLSNNYKNSLIVVDSIQLVLLDSKPFKISSFPDGPWKVIPERNYEIEINPNKRRYRINDTMFSYKYNENEVFTILLKSKQKYLYFTRVDVNYFIPQNKDKKYTVSTKEHKVPFPKYYSLDSIFGTANKLDIFLNLYESITPIFIKNELGYSDSCRVRFVFSDSIRSRTHSTLCVNLNRFNIPKTFNIIPDSLYKSVTKNNPTYFENNKQFIIVNNKYLIYYMNCSRGQIITKDSVVNKYINVFNYCYQKKYIPKDKQYNYLMFKELHIPKIFQRRKK